MLNKVIFIILIVFSSIESFAERKNSYESCDSIYFSNLDNKAYAFYLDNQLDSAIYYANKLLEEAIICNNIRGQGLAYAELCRYYTSIDSLDIALNYALQGLDLDHRKDRLPEARIHNSLTTFFDKTNSPNNALYHRKAVFNLKNTSDNKADHAYTFIEVAWSYLQLENYDSTLVYLNGASEYIKKENIKDEVLNIKIELAFGVTYLRIGDVNNAHNYLSKANELSNQFKGDLNKHNSRMISSIYSNLGITLDSLGYPNEEILFLLEKSWEIENEYSPLSYNYFRDFEALLKKYIDLKKYAKAKDILNSALNTVNQHGSYHDKVKVNNELANFYLKTNNQLKFIETYAQLFDMIDSLKIEEDDNMKVNAELLADYRTNTIKSELRLQKIIKKEAETKIEFLQKEKKSKQILYSFIIGFIITVLIVVVYFFKKRIKDHKEREEFVRTKKDLAEMKLVNKKQDLTDFAIDITRKNDFLNSLYQDLKGVNSKIAQENAKNELNELLISLRQQLVVDDNSMTFQNNVEQINYEYFNNLTAKFPDLTTNEKQLCALIRLALSNKEIAVLKNITTKSVKMARYRLRKKLNLSPDEDIVLFLQTLTKEA